MEKTMTPSGITSGQIGKIQEILGAGLRKSGLKSEPVQQMLETQGDQIVAEMIAVVRRYVEAVSDLIIRRVKVDRVPTPQQILDATARRQYTSPTVVKDLPRGNGEEAEVYFFKLGRYTSDEKLEEEYAIRGLKPADPYSLAAVNKEDSAFADNYPNCTHWKDAEGNWCYIAFCRWCDERSVYVDRYASVWGDRWWFAGLRK